MNGQINPKRISPVFFAIVFLWSVASCNSPENIVADDAPAYRAYMEHNNTLFNADIFTNQRVFIRKIDSFHASRRTHSPHAIALMHLDASRYYFELREIDSATIHIYSALFFAQSNCRIYYPIVGHHNVNIYQLPPWAEEHTEAESTE